MISDIVWAAGDGSAGRDWGSADQPAVRSRFQIETGDVHRPDVHERMLSEAGEELGARSILRQSSPWSWIDRRFRLEVTCQHVAASFVRDDTQPAYFVALRESVLSGGVEPSPA
jgi:hypothetical protein